MKYASKRTSELVRRLERLGWRAVGMSGRAHVRIEHPEHGVYRLAGTPGDRRNEANALADIARIMGLTGPELRERLGESRPTQPVSTRKRRRRREHPGRAAAVTVRQLLQPPPPRTPPTPLPDTLADVEDAIEAATETRRLLRTGQNVDLERLARVDRKLEALYAHKRFLQARAAA